MDIVSDNGVVTLRGMLQCDLPLDAEILVRQPCGNETIAWYTGEHSNCYNVIVIDWKRMCLQAYSNVDPSNTSGQATTHSASSSCACICNMITGTNTELVWSFTHTCIYIYIYVYVYVYVYVCIYIYIYVYIYIWLYMYLRACICTYVCTHVYTDVWPTIHQSVYPRLIKPNKKTQRSSIDLCREPNDFFVAGNLSTVVIFVYFQHILELHTNHGLKSLCRPFQKIQHWFDPYASSHIWSRLLEVALARLVLEYDLQTCPSQSSPWGFGKFQLGETTKHGEQDLFTNVDLLNLLEIGGLKFRFGEMVDTQGCHSFVFWVYCLQINSYCIIVLAVYSHYITYARYMYLNK